MKNGDTSKPIRYSKGYAVIVKQRIKSENGGRERVVLNIRKNYLSTAQPLFDYHANNLKWSLRHRMKLGIPKEAEVSVHLYDLGERFDLREEVIGETN
jgi:hypothetical protein